MRFLAKMLIRGYQLGISPYLGANCKYFPSCSAYGYVAIDRFGMVKGGWLTLKRIARCGPNCAGGYDPVPELDDSKTTTEQKNCCSCKTRTR